MNIKGYPYEIGVTLQPQFKKASKTIFVFGDSFAELGGLKASGKDFGHDNTVYSWMNIVCQLLEVNVTSYGVPASGEFLTHLLYHKTLDIKRDYTIICHSRYDEQDRCYITNTNNFLNSTDMKNWDSLCSQNTLHFYWVNRENNPYHFNNGKALYLEDLGIDAVTSCSNPLFKATCANHMTLNDSIHFAKNVISLIGDQIHGTQNSS